MTNEAPTVSIANDSSQGKKPRCFWRRLAKLVIIVLLLGLIAAVIFVYSQMMQLDHRLNDAVATQTTALKDVQTAVTTLNQDAPVINNDLQTLKQTITDLQQTVRGGQQDWLVATAYYYVKLANEKLVYEHNPILALSLLHMADQEVSQMTTPRAGLLHQALAQDISTLQAIPQVDIANVYSQLTSLTEQLGQLPLLSEPKPELSNTANTEVSADQSWWRRGLQATWQGLHQIIIVRHHNPGELPLIAPEQKGFLYQNLQALALQATWALLEHNNTVYQTSLKQISAWVKQYGLPDAALTHTVNDELTNLQQINVEPALPTTLNALTAFNQA